MPGSTRELAFSSRHPQWDAYFFQAGCRVSLPRTRLAHYPSQSRKLHKRDHVNHVRSASSRYNVCVSENDVQQVASADFPTRWGKFRIYGFRGQSSDGDRRVEEAVALVM